MRPAKSPQIPHQSTPASESPNSSTSNSQSTERTPLQGYYARPPNKRQSPSRSYSETRNAEAPHRAAAAHPMAQGQSPHPAWYPQTARSYSDTRNTPAEA